MKASLKFFAMAAIAATTLFSSCDDENETGPSGAEILTYSGKVMGGQDNLTSGSYFAVTEGQVYSAADARTNVGKVDFSYAALSTDLNPTILSWDERDNNTGLQATVPSGARKCYFRSSSVTVAQFNAMTSTESPGWASNTVSTSSPERITVAPGGVYEFLTADNERGFIHVSSITNGLTGDITFNVKVEKK